jgi:hypothetical protein
LSLKDHDFDITGAADCPPPKNRAKKLLRETGNSPLDAGAALRLGVKFS